MLGVLHNVRDNLPAPPGDDGDGDAALPERAAVADTTVVHAPRVSDAEPFGPVIERASP